MCLVPRRYSRNETVLILSWDLQVAKNLARFSFHSTFFSERIESLSLYLPQEEKGWLIVNPSYARDCEFQQRLPQLQYSVLLLIRIFWQWTHTACESLFLSVSCDAFYFSKETPYLTKKNVLRHRNLEGVIHSLIVPSQSLNTHPVLFLNPHLLYPSLL